MKKFYVLIIVLLLLPYTAVNAFSVDESIDKIADDTQSELFSAIDSDTAKALEAMGIDSLDFDKIYNASFSSLASYFSTDAKEKAQSALKSFSILLCVLLITAAVKSITEHEDSFDCINLIAACAIVLLTVSSISDSINSVLSVLSLSSKFMTAYIPIFALIISLSGNAAAALTYNTVVLAFSQGISAFSNQLGVAVIGAFLCVSIAFSVGEAVNLNRLNSAFNRCISIAVGFVSTAFAAILSIKGVMAASVDSVGVKSVRFLISSMVPVVGSAISEAYSSLLGSINLIKDSVAVIGILAVVIINIPAIIQALFYYISMSLLSVAGESLGMAKLSSLFRSFCIGLKFLLLLVILNVFALVISTGLMLSMKGGA